MRHDDIDTRDDDDIIDDFDRDMLLSAIGATILEAETDPSLNEVIDDLYEQGIDDLIN